MSIGYQNTLQSGKHRHEVADLSFVLLALGVGSTVFVTTMGIDCLDPTEWGWLMHGDFGSHFLGADAFRREPWGWPLGQIRNINFPAGASVVYTDSLPLLALPLKLLHSYLPDPFQSVGIWFLLCWMLQAAFGYLLCLRLGGGRWASLGCAALLTLLPTLFFRVPLGHVALVGQWLLLWALWIFLSEQNWRSEMHFLGVVWIAAAVQVYLMLLVLLIWGTWYCVHIGHHLRTSRHALWRDIASMVLSLASLGCWLWALGYFVLGDLRNAPTWGFGRFSMNLNALINPQHSMWSRLFEPRPLAFQAQNEGFQYAGLGVLLLWGVAVAIMVVRPTMLAQRVRSEIASWRWLAVPCIFVTVLAASDVVSWDSHKLFDLPFPVALTEMLGVVRSSGRLFWLVTLFLIASAFKLLVSRLPRPLVAIFMVCIVAVQYWDISDGPKRLHRRTYAHPLTAPEWRHLFDRARHAHFYPPHQPKGSMLYAVTYEVNRRSATVNTARLSRTVTSSYAPHAVVAHALERGEPDPRALYFVRPAAVCSLGKSARQKIVGEIDGYFVVASLAEQAPLPNALEQKITRHCAGDNE